MCGNTQPSQKQLIKMKNKIKLLKRLHRVHKEQLYEPDTALIFNEGTVYGRLNQILESG